MGVKFYCGVNEKIWNYYPVSPGDYVCVSPIIGSQINKTMENKVFIPESVREVIVDSGAFCDGLGERQSFESSLDRQYRHMDKYKYQDKVTHLASYDLLIDEKWDDLGVRHKIRWNEEDSWFAVNETIRSAEYINNHRNGFDVILSAQGITIDQYLKCAEEIVPMMSENDIFGLGGWCILGIKRNVLKKSFEEIMMSLLPYLSSNGINKVHIWGMMYAPALGELLWLCDKNGLSLSLDSSGPQKRPVFGNWGYADWKDKSYSQPPTSIRGQERARHVIEVIKWLDNFRNTKWYKKPDLNEKWRIGND